MSDLVPLVALWEHRSKKTNKPYWRGKLGEASVTMFKQESENPKAPVFKIFLSEYVSKEERERREAELVNPVGPLLDDPEIPF